MLACEQPRLAVEVSHKATLRRNQVKEWISVGYTHISLAEKRRDSAAFFRRVSHRRTVMPHGV